MDGVEVGRSRRGFWVGTVAMLFVVASALGWWNVHFDSSLEAMLPENSEARQTVAFLRDAEFASKAIVWLKLTDENSSIAELFAAAERIEARLDQSLIRRVVRFPKESDALTEVLELLDHAGELLSESDLAELDAMTTPDALRRRMRECFVQISKPDGSFMRQIVRRDPLGINVRVLGRLFELTKASGFKAEVRDGQLIDSSGRQLLMVLETSVPVTSVEGSHRLTNHLREAVAIGTGINATVICGHLHTANNERLMQRDLLLVTIVDAIGFGLVFLVVCRDWRIAGVFILPIVTIAVAVGICGLAYWQVSTIVVGLSATMAGSAVDYGIHMYSAVRHGQDRYAAARKLVRPLITGALPTMSVFVAFLFSRVPAYRQLGFMASLSLALAVVAAIWVLPAIVRPGGEILSVRGIPLRDWGRRMARILPLLVLAIAIVAMVATRVRFDPDMSKLDGAGPEVQAAEKAFEREWGTGEEGKAILAIKGTDKQVVSAAGDELTARLAREMGPGQVISFGAFWPSESTRRRNFERWKAYWSDERVSALRKNITEAGDPYGFAPDAFEPFFAAIGSSRTSAGLGDALASLGDQFVTQSNGQWQYLIHFPDSEANVAVARAALAGRQDAVVVSRRALGEAFKTAAVGESKLIAAIGGAFILVSLLAMTRSLRDTLLMLLPAAIALAVMLALIVAVPLSLNVATVIVAVVVMGLSIDYGAFTLHAWKSGDTALGHGMISVHLSAITTQIGAGALLFAQHPALFLVGTTLSAGLAAGYLTAFLVLPAICWLADQVRQRRAVC